MSFHWEMAPKVPMKQPPSFVLNATLFDYFNFHIISCVFEMQKKPSAFCIGW